MSSNPVGTNNNDDAEQYRFLVVDSGPIIRLTGLSTLWKKAHEFYTVPAVLHEIRDAKARQHLESLPFELKTRDPTPEAMQAIVDFSRQTGDYQSLSAVDLQILALSYDLEKQATGGDMDHVRKTPKRVVGVGKVEKLAKEGQEEKKEVDQNNNGHEFSDHDESSDDDDHDDDSSADDSDNDEKDDDQSLLEQQQASSVNATPQQTTTMNKNCGKPRSWAALVNPAAAASSSTSSSKPHHGDVVSAATATWSAAEAKVADQAMVKTFGSMTLSKVTAVQSLEGGQFSDPEEDDDDHDDDEVNEESSQQHHDEGVQALEQELVSEFPSLSASLRVPYEGSDNEEEVAQEIDDEAARKRQALAPVSKSGKLYNTFGKYKKLLKPKPAALKPMAEVPAEATIAKDEPKEESPTLPDGPTKTTQSRILGGGALGGQEADFEDDGEGWISTVSEINKMKSLGVLDPKNNPDSSGAAPKPPQGPPNSQRAACTTTDFAMQNVLLQMNLELLSVDGVKVRKLKSWVQRCGACFKVYTNAENTGPIAGKRLFCDHCGSNMIQRIACSVDSKTGRLRLHLSKNYKHNLRGTKFSLPKPGMGNRFQGDLLLAEDQLMTGAWNQKVKMRSGGKAKASAQSMFGRDIASNVGCNTRSMTEDDIRVGFGRRNPNAVKGRERRGKKKKSSDKACGLRRY